MSKFKRTAAAALLLALLCAFPAFSSASAADSSPFSYEVAAVDVSYPRALAITVYTPSFGATCGVKESYNALEIAVSGNRVVSVGGVNNAIPSDGYVAVVRGSELKKNIESLGIKAGDSVVFDKRGMEIVFITESYSPFYEKTVNYDFFNATRSENKIVIYDNGGKTTGTNIWGYEVVVDGNGFVASIGGNNNDIPVGGFVVSAVGRERIAELTEAAAPGMKATIDKTAKKVVFAFSEESIIGGMTVSRNNFGTALEKARKAYANIDYDRADSVLSSMNSCIEAATKAKEGGDLAGEIIAKYEFAEYEAKAETAAVENPAVEARAMWLRPTDSGNREKVNAKVKAVYEAGYNSVCIELLYNSVTIFPIDTKEYLFSQDPTLGGFDVLAAYIEECHKYGIEVFGWISCYRVSHGSTTNSSLAVSSLKPEWLTKAKSGTTDVGDTAGKFLNPAMPEVSEFLLNFYNYIISSYALDGFQLDYIRYPYAPGEEFGYDDYTRGLFEDEYGADPMTLTKTSSLWNTWCKFRASFVTEFVKRVSDMVRELRPDMYVAADVAPDFRDVYVKYMQEAEKWLSEGIIDIGFPMAYGTNVVPLYSSFTVDAAGDGAYSYIGIGDYGTDILKREIVETREAGGDGFAFFSWSQYLDGNYTDEIASTILASPSLSPSYDATAAVKAQIAYLQRRLGNVLSASPDAFSEQDADKLRTAMNDALAKAEAGTDKDTLTGSLETVLEAIAPCANAEAKSVLTADAAKALKIAALSKDSAKAEYRKTNPLPDPYDEPSEEPSEEPSAEVSEASSEESNPAESIPAESSEASASDTTSTESGDNGGSALPIIGIVAGILAAAAVVFAIFKFRKRS